MPDLTVQVHESTGRETPPPLDWFVDSVNGSDSYTGKGPDQAFATIAKLLEQSIVSGQNIALMRGSHWREKLIVSTGNVGVYAYGSGAKPLLDCSVAISAGAWSKTGGYTYVYECSVVIDYDATITWVSAWEDDVRLVRATSIANCDATAGSYYPSSDTSSPITLYVHASDGSDPGTNGKTYEYSKWRHGLWSDQINVTADGIQTRRNLHNDGSLVLGGSGAHIANCSALEGSKHNLIVGVNSLVEHTEALYAYFGVDGGYLFTYVCGSATGTVIFRHCTGMNVGSSTLIGGLYGHSDTNAVTVLCEACDLSYIAGAFSGQGASATLNGCTVTNCNKKLVAFSMLNVTVLNSSLEGSDRGICDASDGGTVTVRNSTLRKTSDGEYSILLANSMTVILENVYLDWQGVALSTGTNCSVTINGSRFYVSQMNISLGAGSSFGASDNNRYRSAVGVWKPFYISPNDYNFVGWQDLTGQDLHSIFGDPLNSWRYSHEDAGVSDYAVGSLT